MILRPLRRRPVDLVPSVICLTLACLLPGCFGGGGAPTVGVKDRVNASGKVTFDGQPIPAGTVSFLNHDTGNMAICEIDDGYYENESDAGPNPGRTTVTIVGKETEDGNPMWATAWKKDVTVAETDFAEDFDVPKDQVKPFDPKTIHVDD